MKAVLTSSFGEYVGGYLNFSPEDSSSNAPVGMGIGPLLTRAVICCPVIEESDGKYCSSRQAAGRQTRGAALLNCQGFQPEERGASWQKL